MSMTNTEFAAEIIGEEQFYVWHGIESYDTRPYVKVDSVEGLEQHDKLPVAYYGANACNHIHDEGDVEAGDVLAFVTALPIGAVVVVPDYSGYNYLGQTSYIRAPNGWLHLETYSSRLAEYLTPCEEVEGE